MSGHANHEAERPSKGYRYSLRTLIVASTIAALLLAFASHSMTRLRRHQQIVTRIQMLGGRIEYDDPFYMCLSLQQGFTAHEVIWLIIGSNPLTHVESVSFNGRISFRPSELAIIHRFPKLVSLLVAGPGITDAHMNVVGTTPQLQRLVLDNTRVSRVGVARLRSARHLTSLSLIGASITDETLRSLHVLPGLRELKLARTRITSQGLVEVGKLSHLRSLEILESPGVDDRGLLHVRDLKGLEKLALVGTKITDTGLVYLRGLDGLTALDLSGTRITNAGLRSLTGLSHLTSLALAGTQIDDDGVAIVCQLRGLQALELRGTGVTNASLTRVAKLNDLRALGLWHTQVSAAGLRSLHRLHRLLFLAVDTRIPTRAVLELKRVLPECEVTLINSKGAIVASYPGATPPWSWDVAANKD